MGFLRWLLRRGPRIEAHTLGVLDLSGGTAGALMAADQAALAPLFRRVSESTDAPPRSTLLLVYCTIAADGAILNSARSLREIIREAGAPVVVVASPNSGQSYTVAANRNKRLARANLRPLLPAPRRRHEAGHVDAARLGEARPPDSARHPPRLPRRDLRVRAGAARLLLTA